MPKNVLNLCCGYHFHPKENPRHFAEATPFPAPQRKSAILANLPTFAWQRVCEHAGATRMLNQKLSPESCRWPDATGFPMR